MHTTLVTLGTFRENHAKHRLHSARGESKTFVKGYNTDCPKCCSDLICQAWHLIVKSNSQFYVMILCLWNYWLCCSHTFCWLCNIVTVFTIAVSNTNSKALKNFLSKVKLWKQHILFQNPQPLQLQHLYQRFIYKCKWTWKGQTWNTIWKWWRQS
jgi:hypothetical protein